VGPLVTLPHILLVIAGAFLIGVRAYAETHPKSIGADADSQQLMRLAKYASVALVLVMVLVVVGLDLGMVHTARAVQ
jgi:quinol-cytochrome oxidoreductase complex cytochrome b subunit